MLVRRAGVAALAVVLAPAVAAVPTASAQPAPRLGLHTMLYLDHPADVRERMLAAARAMGIRLVRLDVQLNAVFAGADPDWRTLDATRAILRRRGLTGLGVLYGTPGRLADCPAGVAPGDSYRCPPRDLDAWAAMVARTVRRAPEIRYWEVLNEADHAGAFFYGDACRYAALLDRTTQAVHAADPAARTLISGPAGPDRAWLRAVVACAPGVARTFDVAAVHLRAPAAAIGRLVRRTRAIYRGIGFRGPLWVTELGYPSDPAFQTDPACADGEAGQARWLARAVPAAWRAGAAAVFVTGRDSAELGDSPFASEGVLRWPSLAPKPQAFAELQRLARRRPAEAGR